MRRKIKLARAVSYFAAFIIAVIFIAFFGGPNILKGYIETGIGGCLKIPILCKAPSQDITDIKIDKDYLAALIPHVFPNMSVSCPRGFMVVQELHKRPYYKKRIARHKESVIYVFRQDPGYFIKLFPQVKSAGIKDNYDFIKRLTCARTDQIKNITDAFFVILKSVFTPDTGDQNSVVMASFSISGKKGFISYNLFDKEYYFDCNLVDDNGDFFKAYIKDLNKSLGVKEVLAIISTLQR
ncbi:MAG: hypothetical protein JXL82_00050 [Candidatus Omnitrophica bacterium]|nr:hypothetical protein [Candidatus Omnitrophota bacterium]